VSCDPTSVRGTKLAVLGAPNKREHTATVRELLADVSRRLGGRLASAPAGPGADGGGVRVDALLADGRLFPALTRAAGPRFESDDRALVGAQLVREWVAAITAAAVTTWGRDRRLFDWSARNVLVRSDGTVALRRADLLVLPDDELAGLPGVTVTSKQGLLDGLLDGALGRDPGDSAVATVIAAARRAVRSGDRHYWGTVAVTAANTLTTVSHEVGPRADWYRELILARRPDLARTVEVLTVDDGHGDTVSCARRLTCCLLVKLPGAVQCGTCNLRDRDQCAAAVAAWARAERARHRAAAAYAS
jgi:hypothetical protein